MSQSLPANLKVIGRYTILRERRRDRHSVSYAAVDPALVRLSGALDEKRAPQPVSDAVSALVNLGYAQPQAAAAIAAAARSAGDGAQVQTLIRLGLKELSR